MRRLLTTGKIIISKNESKPDPALFGVLHATDLQVPRTGNCCVFRVVLGLNKSGLYKGSRFEPDQVKIIFDIRDTLS